MPSRPETMTQPRHSTARPWEEIRTTHRRSTIWVLYRRTKGNSAKRLSLSRKPLRDGPTWPSRAPTWASPWPASVRRIKRAAISSRQLAQTGMTSKSPTPAAVASSLCETSRRRRHHCCARSNFGGSPQGASRLVPALCAVGKDRRGSKTCAVGHRSEPQRQRLHYLAGLFWAGDGELDRARDVLRVAAKLSPNDVKVARLLSRMEGMAAREAPSR